jgi:pimeloyl-ACP methyl ester carboxylesterase
MIASVTEFAPGRPRLLLLHGFFAGKAAWDRVGADMRRDGIDIFAPDLLGYGDHRHGHEKGDYSLERIVEHLAPTVERLRPTHIVGHSMGGMVALGLDELLPGRFHSIGIVGLPVFANARDGKAYQELRGRRYRIFMRTHSFSHYGCGVVHSTRYAWKPFAHHFAPRQPESIFMSVFDHSRDAHLAGLTHIAFGGLVPKLANAATAPISMLHGIRDRTAPLERAREVAIARGWDFETADRANHQVIVERPLLVADWIRRKVCANR